MSDNISRVREGRPDLEKALAGALSKMAEQEIDARLKFFPLGMRFSKAELASLLLMPLDMPLTACDSSNVAAYGVDERSAVVAVRFKGGGEYRYLGLSEGMLYAIEWSPSKGQVVSMLKNSGTAYAKVS
jgi:hypothetical protein